MSRDNPTARPPAGKPTKPYPEFPLFPHATKRWAKKIRGAMHYFGPWDDPDGALKKYLAEKDDLHAGRKPRVVSTGVTVKDLANAFLNHKKAKLDAGELSPRTWMNNKEAADLVVDRFGKSRLVTDLRQDDFADAPLREPPAGAVGHVPFEQWAPAMAPQAEFIRDQHHLADDLARLAARADGERRRSDGAGNPTPDGPAPGVAASNPSLTAADLAKELGLSDPMDVKAISTFLSGFRRENAHCAVEAASGTSVNRSRYLYHRSDVWGPLLEFAKRRKSGGRRAEPKTPTGKKRNKS